MRPLVLTGFNNQFRKVSEFSHPSVKEFCSLNDYNHKRIIFSESDVLTKHYGKDIPASYLKIVHIRTHLKFNDWVLWIDTDAAIVNTEFDLESIIKPNKDIYISKDINGINCGVMLIRKSKKTLDFFNKVWEMKDDFISHKWWEQGAIMELYEKDAFGINTITEYVPQSIFNAYEYSQYGLKHKEGEICKETFIAHFPALPIETRIELIKKYTNS